MMDYMISILTQYHVIHNAYITTRIDSMHCNSIPRSSNDRIKRFATPREIATLLYASNIQIETRSRILELINNTQFIIL